MDFPLEKAHYSGEGESYSQMLSHDSPSQKLAIGLALLAGFIDALGYFSLGGVFVSFMSGNSTRFAVDVGNKLDWHLAL